MDEVRVTRARVSGAAIAAGYAALEALAVERAIDLLSSGGMASAGGKPAGLDVAVALLKLRDAREAGLDRAPPPVVTEAETDAALLRQLAILRRGTSQQ